MPVVVAEQLGISKASVSEMLRKLVKEKLVRYESFKTIKLTPTGLRKAQQVSRNFKVLQYFLEKVLKIDAGKAYTEACKLEHAFSDEVIGQLYKHVGSPKL